MSLPKTTPTITNSWNKLAQLAKDPKTLQHYFADDASRAAQFSIAWDSFFVDYSKNHIDKDIQAAQYWLAPMPDPSGWCDDHSVAKTVVNNIKKRVMRQLKKSKRERTFGAQPISICSCAGCRRQ